MKSIKNTPVTAVYVRLDVFAVEARTVSRYIVTSTTTRDVVNIVASPCPLSSSPSPLFRVNPPEQPDNFFRAGGQNTLAYLNIN